LCILVIAISIPSFAHFNHNHDEETDEGAYSTIFGSAGLALGSIFNGMEFYSHFMGMSDFKDHRPRNFAETGEFVWHTLELATHGMNVVNYVVGLLGSEPKVLDDNAAQSGPINNHRSYFVGLSAMNAAALLLHCFSIKRFLEREASFSNKVVLLTNALGLVFHAGDFYYSAAKAIE